MTGNKKLKEAVEWYENSPFSFPESWDELGELLLAYHHHMLDKAWVRFADKKPEKRGTYNVNVSGFGILLDGVHTLYWNSENKLWIDSERHDRRIKSTYHDYVVDYQPLPKPPKE